MSNVTSISKIRLSILLLCIFTTTAWANMSPYDWAFQELDAVRQEKVALLEGFCERIHQLAQQAATDTCVQACFEINLQMSQAQDSQQVPSGSG